jgi:NAD+ synthetase
VDTAKLEPSGISKKTVIIETEDSLEAVLKALILGTKDYARKCGFTRGLVGLSGGIDSALIAVIGAEAFGADNMDAMLMPSRYSSDGSVVDAKVLAENLGISIQIVSIDPIFKEYLHTLHPVLKSNELGVTEENIQARIRGNILMAKSNYTGSLLLTTGNKSEMATGYCTLYGDMAGGFASISDVPKTMVYRLCELINRGREIIPQAIIDKPPSAELRPDQKDSDSLPDYGELDQIIEGHILHDKDRDALEQEGFDSVLIDRILHLIQVSEYKRRQAPPGIKLTAKAFGSGRRMPLAQRWKP